MAHPQVTAHAGGALLGTVGAADLLNLLSQGLESGINLHVAIAHHVGVISTVVATTEGIRGLLLKRLADKVKSTSGRSRGAGRSRRSRRTLFEDSRGLQTATIKVSEQVYKYVDKIKCNLQKVPSLHCDHEVQGVQWVQADRSCHLYQGIH